MAHLSPIVDITSFKLWADTKWERTDTPALAEWEEARWNADTGKVKFLVILFRRAKGGGRVSIGGVTTDQSKNILGNVLTDYEAKKGLSGHLQ